MTEPFLLQSNGIDLCLSNEIKGGGETKTYFQWFFFFLLPSLLYSGVNLTHLAEAIEPGTIALMLEIIPIKSIACF